MKVVLFVILVSAFCFGAGSRESDSLTLIALMNCNPSISERWSGDIGKPLEDWYEVTMSNGRISELKLFGADSLPDEIGLLDSLKSLDLDFSEITTLPEDFSQLTQLERLSIYSSKIATFPPALIELGSLRNLSFALTPLGDLPEEISDMVNLESLYIRSSPMTMLPKNIEEMQKLISLRLEQVCLQFDSYEFAKSLSGVNVEISRPNSRIPTVISEDSTFLFVDVKGSANKYQWFENYDSLPGESKETIFLSRDEIISNSYHCEITSEIAELSHITLRSDDTLTTEIDYNESTPILSNSVVSPQVTLTISNNVIHLENTKQYSLKIFSVNGRLLKNFSTIESTVSLDLLGLANGIYQFRIVQGADVFTGQFILK